MEKIYNFNYKTQCQLTSEYKHVKKKKQKDVSTDFQRTADICDNNILVKSKWCK